MAEETMSAAAQSEQPGSAPAGAEDAAPNYDELLKTDKGLQSWLDRRVNAATQTAVQKALEKERLLADEKVSEAEKLARMTKEEKTAYELEKLKRQLADYEAEKAANSLRAEALKLAAEQGLPAELAELIPFGSVTAEEVSRKLSGMKAVFDGAVAAQVAKSLAGAGTPKGGPEGGQGVTEEEVRKMDYAQRLALKQRDPQLYETLRQGERRN